MELLPRTPSRSSGGGEEIALNELTAATYPADSQASPTAPGRSQPSSVSPRSATRAPRRSSCSAAPCPFWRNSNPTGCVLLRLGYGEEKPNYSTTYKLVQEAIEPELVKRCHWPQSRPTSCSGPAPVRSCAVARSLDARSAP